MAERGTPLVHPSTGLCVKDFKNNPIKSVGGWKSPSMCYKVHAAVLFLHKTAYPGTCSGPYVQECTACQMLNATLPIPEDSLEYPAKSTTYDVQESLNYMKFISNKYGFFQSCPKHANSPPLRSSGNVLNNPSAKKIYDSWLKIKQHSHVTKGCGQLYPSELRRLRSYLLSEGSPGSYQMWVMILLGVRLFLRCDELITLKIDNFVDSYYPQSRDELIPPKQGENALTKCQVVNRFNVEALVCKIQGKSDKKPVRLCLFTDDEHTDLDELRHLLWYLKMFNIKGGYLFPKVEDLEENLGAPLIADSHISYKEFLRKFKGLVTTVLLRDENIFIVGTHTLQKTAYLMAIWGFYYASQANTEVAVPCKFVDCIIQVN